MTAYRAFRTSLFLTAMVLPWVLSLPSPASEPAAREPAARKDAPADTGRQDLLRELKALRDQLDRVIQAAERAAGPQPSTAKATDLPNKKEIPLPKAAGPVDEVPALKFDRVGSYGGGYAWNMSLGWEFETTAPIKITALGIWDSDGKGLDVEVPVGIWDATGKLLASARLPTGDKARLVDQFRYADIPPVELPGEKRYAIAALYTPQVKEGNVSHGANVSLAAPLRWIKSCRTRSENLIMPTATQGSTSAEESLGSFGPGFLMAGNDISKGVRNYYRRRTVPQLSKQEIIVVPEQLDGSHRENKIVTISLFALPDGRLTQIVFDSMPLGSGDLAFAKLAAEVKRWKGEKSLDKPSLRLAAMSTVKASDVQLALNVMERGEFDRHNARNVVQGNELTLFARAKVKQPDRDGKFVVEDRFRDAGDLIEDRWTGLLWQKDGTASGKKNFYDARSYAADLKLGGLTGWRVPKIEELATIFPATFAPFTNSKYNADACCSGPAEFASFWTSELDLRLDDYAYVFHWYAHGGANNCFASKNYVYVRCVRDPVVER